MSEPITLTERERVAAATARKVNAAQQKIGWELADRMKQGGRQ